MIYHTGGTTGLPKGAILHYRCVTANSVNTIVSWGLRPSDGIPQYVPFFHTGGPNVLTTPLVHIGGTGIVCASFDIDQLFDQVEQLRVTFFRCPDYVPDDDPAPALAIARSSSLSGIDKE